MVLAILYFLILMPMKKQRKKVEEFQTGAQGRRQGRHDRRHLRPITRVNDNSVQLQIADKVRIEIARAAVGGYQGQEPVVQESGSA